MQPQPPPGYYPPYAPPPPPPKSNAVLWIVLGCVAAGVVIFIAVQMTMASSVKYMKKSKRSEAELNLDAIRKGAKVHYVEQAAFPVGSTGLVPPTSCCDQMEPDRKCVVDPSLWTASPWQELGFELAEPHLYQYSYEGTHDRFTARAVGDLDCDDTAVTYTLEGRVENGNPITEVIEPATRD